MVGSVVADTAGVPCDRDGVTVDELGKLVGKLVGKFVGAKTGSTVALVGEVVADSDGGCV